MKIIFDRKKALKEKMKIEEAVRKENSRRKTNAIIASVASSLGLSAIVIFVFFTKNNLNFKGACFALGILLAFIIPSLRTVLKEDIIKTVFPNTRYTPEVRYLLATKGKTLKDIELKYNNDSVELFIITKNESGFAAKDFVCRLKKRVCKDITDIVVDLQKATVYIPALCLTE